MFTATALLIVVGTAALASLAGLSMSLGAFMAGVLLSDSEYRHELQADIEPFEGLLLGFFFISVGMSANLGLAQRRSRGADCRRPGRCCWRQSRGRLRARAASPAPRTPNALRFSLALPQASEFSFVLFGAAVTVAMSMTPQRRRRRRWWSRSRWSRSPVLFAARGALARAASRAAAPAPDYDAIDGAPAPVIICGFGRMGQIVGRVLRMRRIRFTALEKRCRAGRVVRRFGNKVYYGDPARVDVLRAAGAAERQGDVVALDDMAASPGWWRRQAAFSQPRHLARARNRWHAHMLMDQRRGPTSCARPSIRACG